MRTDQCEQVSLPIWFLAPYFSKAFYLRCEISAFIVAKTKTKSYHTLSLDSHDVRIKRTREIKKSFHVQMTYKPYERVISDWKTHICHYRRVHDVWLVCGLFHAVVLKIVAENNGNTQYYIMAAVANGRVKRWLYNTVIGPELQKATHPHIEAFLQILSNGSIHFRKRCDLILSHFLNNGQCINGRCSVCLVE